MNICLTGSSLTSSEVVRVARQNAVVELSGEAVEQIGAASSFVRQIVENEAPVYGINTGFGSLCNARIGLQDLGRLQENLILSHSVGVGRCFNEDEARATMVVRANTLASGHSGVRLEVERLLLELLNKHVYPMIPSQGSLGASGDLAPLASLALVLIGRGTAKVHGEILQGRAVLDAIGAKPLVLQAKEGLALINGTAVMTGVSALIFSDARMLLRIANLAAAMTMEALRARLEPFDERIHDLRRHAGQGAVARDILSYLAGSRLVGTCDEVQDAYSIRCMPQVHGAVSDTVDFVENVLLNELNAVTDNPLLFPSDGDVLSGGNFHGEPVALAMDYLGIALSELASISERRTNRLLNPALNRGLPAFLTRDAGLNSGLMIAQYTQAALVSENKVLAHPASVDSIPVSADQEDHVSMGTIAARKARSIADNVATVVAIELLAAYQAVDILGGEDKLGMATGKLFAQLRTCVPPMDGDRMFIEDINAVRALIRSNAI
ncbi:MAG: histidine ammonia-lyase [Caldiserica bacterium]|nr:histidine ammonia-lyase [Caldisericota bacterium]